ncbi:unnamed protein product [Cochlearia groenlandica]
MKTATGEADAWSRAQELLLTQNPRVEAVAEGLPDDNQRDALAMSCYTDGSWKEGDATSGVGWVVQSRLGKIA